METQGTVKKIFNKEIFSELGELILSIYQEAIYEKHRLRRGGGKFRNIHSTPSPLRDSMDDRKILFRGSSE